MDQVEEVISRFEERISKQLANLRHVLFKFQSTDQMVECCLVAGSLCSRRNDFTYRVFPLYIKNNGYALVFFPKQDREFERELNKKMGELRIRTNEISEQVEVIRDFFLKNLKTFLTGLTPLMIGETTVSYHPN